MVLPERNKSIVFGSTRILLRVTIFIFTKPLEMGNINGWFFGDLSVSRLTLFSWCPMDFIDFFLTKGIAVCVALWERWRRENGWGGRTLVPKIVVDSYSHGWSINQDAILHPTLQQDSLCRCVRYLFQCLIFGFRGSNSSLFDRQQTVILCDQTILISYFT